MQASLATRHIREAYPQQTYWVCALQALYKEVRRSLQTYFVNSGAPAAKAPQKGSISAQPSAQWCVLQLAVLRDAAVSADALMCVLAEEHKPDAALSCSDVVPCTNLQAQLATACHNPCIDQADCPPAVGNGPDSRQPKKCSDCSALAGLCGHQ